MTAAIQSDACPAGPCAQSSRPVNLRFPAMLGYLLGALVLAAAVGVVPTWRLAGPAGLTCQLSALPAVAVPFLASGIVVLSVARRGIRAVAAAFLLMGLVRLPVSLALGAGAWAVWDLPAEALMIWVAVFYLASLGGETIWLIRAAQRSSQPPARGAKGWS